MAKNILKLTNRKAAVKISGTNVTETISLATDLKLAAESVSSPTANIMHVTWMGDIGAKAVVTRGSHTDPIMILTGDTASEVDWSNMDYNESVDHGEDIKVVTTGTMQVWFLLRKEHGYNLQDPNSFSTI